MSHLNWSQCVQDHSINDCLRLLSVTTDGNICSTPCTKPNTKNLSLSCASGVEHDNE